MARRANNSVLLVDDDADSREALSWLLNECGVSTVQAGNGKEALQQLRCAPPPALILLDLQMPIMDGWTFLQHWSEDREMSHIPVVVMTGGNLVQQCEVIPVVHWGLMSSNAI